MQRSNECLCWDSVNLRSGGPNDAELTSILILFPRVLQGDEVKPPALAAKALLGLERPRWRRPGGGLGRFEPGKHSDELSRSCR
jgi:hypothetical protein